MYIYTDKICDSCGSNIGKVEKSGPHNKLVCRDCGAYIKMVSQKELDQSIKLKDNKSIEEKLDEINFKLDVLLEYTGAMTKNEQ